MTKIKQILCFLGVAIALALANPAVIEQVEEDFVPYDAGEQYDNGDLLDNNNIYEIDTGYAVSSEEDDGPYLKPSDVPGCSYADTPQKLQAMGIQTNRIDPGILEDSFLSVVSAIYILCSGNSFFLRTFFFFKFIAKSHSQIWLFR